MTVVLGQRPGAVQTDPVAERRNQWIERFRTGSRKSEVPTGPPPVPMAEVRLHMQDGYVPAGADRRNNRHALVDLYASRIDVQKAHRMFTGRTLHQRGGAGPRTILRDTQPMGRGTEEHYTRLYPARRHVADQLRDAGRFMSLSEVTHESVQAIRSRFRVDAWRSMFARSARFGRMSAPRRVVMASMVVLILLAGAATSTLARQQRYEVQAGDTVESIANEFGVDPEGIFRSSYMPNGWTISEGQVVIIPDQGQAPAEAAAMAAEREETSPWVKGAHWVEYGDTLDLIGTEWGVSVEVLMNFNDIVDPTTLVAGQRILIPYERGDDSASTAVSGGPIVSAPIATFAQTRNLSCEFAVTYAATTAFGPGVSEQTFIDSTPITLNPHSGYRGDIDGWWGNTDDYGVYAEALVPTLNAHGYIGEVMYTQGDVDPLLAQLDAGRPVVTWLGFWGDTRDVKHDEGTYSVFAGMHVVTVYGYDNDGVYVMDPAKGATQHFDWATFTQLWNVVDGMGLAVYPM